MKKSTSLFVLIVGLLIIISVSFGLLSQDNSLTDEQKVMKIAVDYVKENYGTDYVINGEVSNNSFTEHTQEGNIVYNYPTASFRIPEDYFESGQLVNVMVDPDTEEIIKVYTNPSKGFPPYAIDISNWEAELRQGESTSTNITLTLVYTEEEVTISFSLELGAYQNMPVGSNDPFPFEALFEPEQLVLKHQEPHITILTITADDDAPLGLYTLTISASDGNKGIGATIMITVVDTHIHPLPYLSPVWQRPLQNFATSLTVGEGKVFTTDDPGNVFCFDTQNGESLWNSSGMGRARNPTPVLSNGLFYFGFEERELGCLDGNNGTLLWTFQNIHAPEEARKGVSAHPIIKGDRLFAVSGSVSAHNLTTRRLLWQAVPGQTNFGISFPNGQMKANLLHGHPFDAKYVYATGGNFSNLNFFKIDTESKRVIWRSNATWGAFFVPFYGGSIPYPDVLAVTEEKVIIRISIKDESFVNFFLCLDSTTGEELWSIDVGASIYDPIVYDNLLLFGTGDGYFYAVRLADGTIAWTTKVDTKNLFSIGVHSSSPIQIDSDNQRLFWSYAVEENESSNYTGTLISLDFVNGDVMWMTQTNSSSGGLAFNNFTDMLFLTTYRFAADVSLWIFNASTGDLTDSQQQYDHYILPPVVYGNETFVAADLWLTVY